jgi:hypothetical protein
MLHTVQNKVSLRYIGIVDRCVALQFITIMGGVVVAWVSVVR